MGPEVGTLAGLLADHTSAADACSFALWSGFGEGGSATLYMAAGSLTQRLATRWARAEERWRDWRIRQRHRRLPTFSLLGGGRRYLLFHGRATVAESFWSSTGHCPAIWWPEDRAWFVHTEIDGTSTYVGGSRVMIDRLVGDQILESFEMNPGDLAL
jgi:hypothetical protein